MTSSQTDRIGSVNSSAAIKVPCRVATTANITLSGLQTIDGVALAAGDRVLVKNQSTGSQNGIYVASSTAWSRDADFSNNQGVTRGTIVVVNEGTANTQLLFQLTTANPITIGTTSLAFTMIGTLAGAISGAMAPVVAASTLSAARTALGVAIGSAVQAFSGLLADIAGITFARGDVLFYDGTHLAHLAPGTSGQVLQTGGAGADPAWATPASGSAVPTGSVIAFAGSAAPSGYALCAGQAISRSTFSALFAIIGTTYGVGDGSTTFNVPDLRGRTLAGLDNMGGSAASRLTGTTMSPDGQTLGANGGAQAVTLTAAQSGVAAHSHTASSSAAGQVGGASSEIDGGGSSFSYLAPAGGISISTTVNAASATPAAQAHSNVQPTLLMNWIVKT